MLDSRKIKSIAGFVVLCWMAIGALIGIGMGLAHILKSTFLAVMVLQVVIYSVAFGFLGWLRYKSKVQSEKWRGMDSGGPADIDRGGSEETDRGWK